jgi:hypothetical protein
MGFVELISIIYSCSILPGKSLNGILWRDSEPEAKSKPTIAKKKSWSLSDRKLSSILA